MGPDKNNAVENHRRDDHRPRAGKIYGKLSPVRDLVYVKPDLEEGGQTESGLYLAKPKHQGPPNTGEVLAVGPDVKEVKVGDHVVFIDPNAKGFWLNDIAHIPLKEEQIVAKVERNKK